MSQQPKCANSYRTNEGRLICKPGTLAEITVHATMADGGEVCGSETSAHATYCRACAVRLLNEVLEGMKAQATHER